MPTQTLIDKFQKYQAADVKLGYYPDQYAAAEAAFYAGAKAEREEVLIIIRDAIERLQTLNAEGLTPMRTVEQRIKERSNG